MTREMQYNILEMIKPYINYTHKQLVKPAVFCKNYLASKSKE